MIITLLRPQLENLIKYLLKRDTFIITLTLCTLAEIETQDLQTLYKTYLVTYTQ